MAKVAARNTAILAGARDVSGRLNSAAFAMSAETPEVTCFGVVNRERLPGGIQDVELTVNGFYDAAASQIDATFASLLAGSAMWGYYPQGKSACKRGKEFTGILSNYTSNAAVADAVAVSSTVTGSPPLLDAIILSSCALTGGSIAASSADNGVDFAGSTSGSVWVITRILSNAGTTPQISACFQDSTDDSAWVTLAVLDSASFGGTSFITVTGSAARYRRYKYIVMSGSDGGTATVTVVVSCGSLMG